MESDEARALYGQYIKAFENRDYEFIADVCRTPFFAASPTGTIVFENRDHLIEGFSSLREPLADEGYVRSRINEIRVTEIAESTVTLFVDFDRMNSQDEAYHNGQALYIMQRSDVLSIIGIIVLDSGTVSKWTGE